MKFFSKRTDSAILAQRLTYKNGSAKNNNDLRDLLVKEQFGFCAYTEKSLQPLDSVEVEHFNSSLKYKDDYYNYYAVIRTANLYKKDEKYNGASFFINLFFQDEKVLYKRIGFANNIYYELNEADSEARDFIDFLNLNHPTLSEQRSKHVKRLKEIFQSAGYNDEDAIEYFSNHKEELSHITAIEAGFSMEFVHLIRN